MSYTSTFRLLAILLGLTLLAAGTLTSFRVHNASQEDYMFIKGMNRLRAAYVDIDPTLAPYFITGLHRRRGRDRADLHDGPEPQRQPGARELRRCSSWWSTRSWPRA